MKIAITNEITATEKRVALVPSLVQSLQKLGCSILMERGAGVGAHYADEDYEGVTFYENVNSLYKDADILLKVGPTTEEEVAQLKKDAIVVGLLSPSFNLPSVIALRDKQLTSFAMELIPRISRAQSMDALSSQATAAGYKAALLGANMSTQFFPMLTTAAGTIRPAQVLVIGAGVAGLQAIATARRLGAVVKAYDVRSAAREQIESLGAKMINIEVSGEAAGGYARELNAEEKAQQQAVLLETIAKTDVIISTAAIPGRPAPKIISKEMVEKMKRGAVIIDTAALTGGNCELTQPGNVVTHQDVLIYGPVDLPSQVARDASNMYAKNLVNFLTLMIKNGELTIDWQDPILAESALTHEGMIKHQATQAFVDSPKGDLKIGMQ